jgi:hypothetical protein
MRASRGAGRAAVGSLLALLIALATSQADAKKPNAAPSAKVNEQQLVAKIKQQPLIFFVARGEPNACGPGCSAWIAAEGHIDLEAGQRFREFLNEPSRRSLPVFFNSLGGNTRQALDIGMLLRQHRMTAGVARTIPDGCRPALAMGEACRRVAQSKPEHKAKFAAAGARCASGCVYALLGASARQVARTAELGIHSVRYIWALTGPPPSKPPSTDVVHEGLRNYAIEMGVDAGLIDAAAKVSADRMHWMTRAEIDRYGVETRSYFETRWTAIQESPQILSIAKSWTRAGAGGSDHPTTLIRLRCGNTFGFLLFYRSELPLFDTNGRMHIRMSVGGDYPRFSALSAGRGAVMYAVVAREALQRAAAEPKLTVTESRGDDERTFALSTAGMSDALAQLLKRCDERTDTGRLTPARTQ